MDTAGWQRAKSIFHEVAAADAADRPALLARLCNGQEEIRTEVEGLLEAHDAAAVSGGAGTRVAGTEAGEKPGDVIDRFKLLQEIGTGGFGTVYMAEQHEPVRRKVALKIVKLGMDSRQVVARFEAERQALAVMDHPNIAKVLDGGTTATGRPYFVMELVKGVPLIEYCDKAGLDTAARLDLFRQVCHAVQHAHQKGIIHRDLKPANVLIALHDGIPVPKVIDFGIAKALDRHLTEKTLFTEFRQIIGTPEYMAPEQAEFSNLDVDTRADIYSLGVILYELITGTKPFDLQKILEQGYGEMLRTIREVDPPKPSTRLSTLGPALPAVAKQRHTEPERLNKLIRGDLDWIVMKSLEKDRSRRYDTADALAADVTRHLADEPILARPPTRAYRIAKYVKRHRLGVLAATAAAVALLAGAGVALAGWSRARTERDGAEVARGEAEAARLEAVASAQESRQAFRVLGNMLASGSPDLLGPQATLAQVLESVEAELPFLARTSPGVEVTVRYTLSTACTGMGRVADARRHLERAMEVARELYGPDSEEMLDCEGNMALVLAAEGRHEEALALQRHVVAAYRKLPPDQQPELATKLTNLAGMIPFTSPALIAERTELIDEAMELTKDLEGRNTSSAYVALLHLGVAHAAAGRPADAEVAFRRSLDLRKRAWGETHVSVARCMAFLGDLLRQRGEYVEAEQVLRDAEQIWLDLDEQTGELQRVRNLLACLRMAQGRDVEAAGLLEDVAIWQKKNLDEHHISTLTTLHNLAGARSSLGQWDRAVEAYEQVIAGTRATCETPDLGLAGGLKGLAIAERSLGRTEESVTHHEEALHILETILGKDNPRVATSLQALALALKDCGRLDEAESHARRGLAIARAWTDGPPDREVVHLFTLGAIASAQADYEEALDFFRKRLEVTKAAYGPDHVDVGRAHRDIAGMLSRLGRDQEARDELQKAQTVLTAALSPVHPDVLQLRGQIRYNARGTEAAGDVEEAKALRDDCLKTLGDAHWQTHFAGRMLAEAYVAASRLEEAERTLVDLLGHMERLTAHNPNYAPVTEIVRAELGQTRGTRGHLDDAVELISLSLEAQKRLLGDSQPREIGIMTAKLAGWEEKAGLTEVAGRHYEEAYELLRERFGSDSPLTLDTARRLLWWMSDHRANLDASRRQVAEDLAAGILEHASLTPARRALTLTIRSQFLIGLERFKEAERASREAFELRMAESPRPWAVRNSQSLLGESIAKQGRHAEAEPILLEAWREMVPPEGGDVRKVEALQRIVDLYEAWEKPEDAAIWRAKLAEENEE